MTTVDSVRKLACQTKIHRGMAIRLSPASFDAKNSADSENPTLCPCLGITQDQIVDRLKQGKLQSPEAILSITRVGEGKCHGKLCMSGFKRVLTDQGIDMSQWIDWRFPWSDWIFPQS